MYPVIRSRAGETVIQREKRITPRDGDESFVRVEYLQFPGISATGLTDHLFTTRLGGVSRGVYSSMNLSFGRGDDREAVLENFRRVAALMHSDVTHMVATDQTHTVNIRRAGAADGGKGICRPREWQDIDGLITDERGLILSAFFADCVPLYFVDPVRRAIGLAHAGWRGTLNRMGPRMVEAMREAFGTEAGDVRVAIGPSICRACYQVDGQVAEAFLKLQEEMLPILEKLGDRFILPDRVAGKYKLDLWLTNLALLYEGGVSLSHIEVTDICTCHNGEYLFSHRKSGGKRGNLGAFLMLRPE